MDNIKSVSDIIDVALEDLGLSRVVELWRIKSAIYAIFDEGFSKNIKVVSLRDGILTLIVPSSVWVQELSFMEQDIIIKVNDCLGGSFVKRIKFKEVY